MGWVLFWLIQSAFADEKDLTVKGPVCRFQAKVVAAAPKTPKDPLVAKLDASLSNFTFVGKNKEQYRVSMRSWTSDGRANISDSKGNSIGLLIFSKTGEELEICDVKIDHDHQGQGITQQLLSRMLTLLPSGTKVSLISSNEETNASLASLSKAMGVGGITAEINKNLEAGELKTVPLWPRVLYQSGYRSIDIQFTDGNPRILAVVP